MIRLPPSHVTRRLACLLMLGSACVALPVVANSNTTANANTSGTETPEGYAYSMPVQVTGKQGVIALKVPPAVYLNARTGGLDDLRVFDAKGLAQPFSLQRPRTETATRRIIQAASIFPVRSPRIADSAQAAQKASGVKLDIKTGPDGSVISVRTDTGAANGDAKNDAQNDAKNEGELNGLVLDFGPSDARRQTSAERIAALRFSAPENQPNYSAQVWLEVSNDLKSWDAVGAAELGWMSNDNAQTLTNDRLELTPQAFRYARLTWRAGEPVVFPAIEAERLAVEHVEPQRETLWIKPQEGKVSGDLAYPAAVALPVEQISLKLSESNIVFPMTLGKYLERPSRIAGKTTEWIFQPVFRATFYQIEQNEHVRRSGPQSIAVTHQQEWIVRPQNAATTAKPELGLSWQADTLVFLAGGTPPYRLAFGRSDARPASQPLGLVAPGFSTGELQQLALAQVGELQTTNADALGESASEQATKAARQRTLLLWGLLILGVVILGGMTWKLVKQMKRPPPGAGGASG